MKYLAFIIIASVLAAPVTARADDLVAEMELEILIREISKETRIQARKLAWAGVKKTSLYAKYNRLFEARKTAVPPELATARDEAFIAWKLAVEAYPPATQRVEYTEAVRASAELYKKYDKLAAESQRLMMEAWNRFKVVSDEVDSLVDKFARRIYLREMTNRLTELKVKITDKVRQQIERSYKHEA